LWVTLKVPVSLPAAIVTEAGAVAALVLELLSVITRPPVGAALLNVAVPVTVVVALPTTVAGETAIDTNVGAWIEIDAFWELVPSVAVTVAVVFVLTAVVLTVNVPVDDPIATLTVAGTIADVELEASLTAMTLLPAVALRLTDPLTDTPPTTLVGDNIKLLTVRGITASVAAWLTPPYVALMVVVVAAVTIRWVTLKVALDVPPGIFTDVGTVAALVLELVSVTVAPAVGATLSSVTVPTTKVCDPPITVVGTTLTL